MPIFSSSAVDSDLIQATASIVNDCLRALLPDSSPSVSEQDVLTLLSEAHVAASTYYGIRAAQEAGKGFAFPAASLAANAALLQSHNYDVASVARARHAELQPVRLSVDRVITCFGRSNDRRLLSTEDFARIVDIAVSGVHIFTPPSFRPSSTPAPLRARYVAVSATIHMVHYKQWLEGKILLAPSPTSRPALPIRPRP